MSRLPSLRMQQCGIGLRQMVTRRLASDVAAQYGIPIILRLRSDLKNALRAKDLQRLNVIKGVLANITNAEKINKPMNSEEKIRKHMLKLAESQRSTAQQFEAANRNDLRDKELAQVAILEAYAAEVKVVPQGQLKDTILKAIEIKKSEGQACNIGTILQVLRRKDGPLQGETFDNAQAIGILKDLDVAGPGVKYVPS